MQSRAMRLLPFSAFLLSLVVFSSSVVASGQTERVIYSFSGSDGSIPTAGLLVDRAGNFYGTTVWGGGGCGQGTVFELTPAAGEWTLTTLHALCSSYFTTTGHEGGNPAGSLTFDSQGNLYGTTTVGIFYDGYQSPPNNDHPSAKPPDCCEYYSYYGPGTAFQLLKPTSTGAPWTINPLFVFDSGNPSGKLTLDSAGNVYGVNNDGSNQGYRTCNPCGTVFELSPQPVGQLWTVSYPHSFGSYLGDGLNPAWDLLALNGTLYGTTQFGGTSSQGTVFEVGSPGTELEFAL